MEWNQFFLEHSNHWRNEVLHYFKYYEDLKPIYTLIFLQGRKVSRFLDQLFGFPSDPTLYRYKEFFLEKFQITPEIFNGSTKSLKLLLKLYTPFENPPRVVFGFDATSLKPYLSINSEGNIIGLCKQKRKLLEEEINKLKF